MQSKEMKKYMLTLESWRVDHDMSQREMAKKLKMSPSNYSKLVSGDIDSVSLDTIVLVHKVTGLYVFQMMSYYDTELNRLIELETKLNKSSIKFLHDIALFEYGIQKDNSNNKNLIRVFVPTKDMYDSMIYDSSNVEILDIGDYAKIYGNMVDCGIKITSNHLHPVYHIDDVLLISFRPPRDGDIGIFINNDTQQMYIRKFRQTNPVQLIPITKYGKTIEVDPNDHKDMLKWYKFGIVITKIRMP